MSKFISDFTLVTKDVLPAASTFIHARDTARAEGDRDIKIAIADFDTGVRETRIATSATPTPNADTTDIFILSALLTNAAFQIPTGTPVQGQRLVLRIKDNSVSKLLSFDPIYRQLHLVLPTSTATSQNVYIFLIFNATDTKWDVMSVFREDGIVTLRGLRIHQRPRGENFRMTATNAGTPDNFMSWHDNRGRIGFTGFTSETTDNMGFTNETVNGKLTFATTGVVRYEIFPAGTHDFKSGNIITLGSILGSNVSGSNTGDEDAASINALGATMNDDVDVKANGWVLDEDDFSSDSDTKVPTQQSTRAFINAAVTGLWDDKGAYDAATNTPDLDVAPAGILRSDAFAVSVAGLFFGATVEVGDMLVAKQDNPTVESDWNIFQANLDASSIKALYESNAETNAFVDAEKTKLTGVEDDATADQTDAEIATAYGNEVAAASQAEMEAGVEAALRTVSPLRIAEAIAALASGGGVEFPQNSQPNDYTLVAEDAGKMIYFPEGNTMKTWTIPANSAVAFPIGTVIKFVNFTGSGNLIIIINDDKLLLQPGGLTGSRSLGASNNATIMKTSATEWIIWGTSGLT